MNDIKTIYNAISNKTANQNYIRIVPKEGRVLVSDAEALGQVKSAILRGTIWDCILVNSFIVDSKDDPNEGRALGVYPKSFIVHVYDPGNTEITTIEVPYTEAQYAGLSAIQLAIDEHNGKVGPSLPEIHTGDMMQLFEAGDVISIGVNGHYLIATKSGDNLTKISLGEQIPEGSEFINITWEDAQKLIGLPVK